MSTSNNTPDYTATLQGWWDNAEQAHPAIGDTVIAYNGDDEYQVFGWTQVDAKVFEPDATCRRVLRRATPPEPERPAWADAPAVIASTDYCERQVWERDATYESRWDGTAGDGAVTRDLRDVTPLYPAAPHDRQVQRAYLLGALVHIGYVDEDDMEEVPDAELDVLIDAVLDR